MEREMRLEIEELEERIAPTCAIQLPAGGSVEITLPVFPERERVLPTDDLCEFINEAIPKPS